MQDFFPDCPRKQQLSQIISTIDTGFNLMTSKLSDSDHSDFSKRPLGGILEIHSKQLSALYEWMDLLENLRFQKQNSKKDTIPPFSKVKCQRGAIISIKCAIALQIILQQKYFVSKYGTQNITQDDLESFFSENRAMDGPNNDPTTLQCNNRISNYVTIKILQDQNFGPESIFTI